MGAIITLILVVIISILIAIATNILYDVAMAFIPLVVVFVTCLGMLVGIVLSIENTLVAYKQVYFKKGR